MSSPKNTRRTKNAKRIERRKVQSIPNAPALAVKPSTYERTFNSIKPLLNGRDVAKLSSTRINALAKAGKVPVTDVRRLVTAHKTAQKVGLPAEALFALGRNGTVPQAAELRMLAPADLKNRLQSAVKAGTIPSSLIASFNNWKPTIEKLQIESAPLATIADQIRLKIPPALAKTLTAKRIHSLADIQRAGGLSNLAGMDAKDRIVKTLDAHANLACVSTDLQLNKKLISRGYKHLLDIARETPKQFVSQVTGAIDPSTATHIHSIATTQARILTNLLTGIQVNSQFGTVSPKDPIASLLPKKCGCDDCDDATSPLAYLADLLDYAIRHVRFNDTPITLTDLENRFHQPFRKLPFSCDAMKEPVRQIRIFIEVLRGYLESKSIAYTVPDELLFDAYKQILEAIGTSLDELRYYLSRPDRYFQQELVDRLMIGNPVQLEKLLPDLDGSIPTKPRLDEVYLEGFFGLRRSTHDPLNPTQESLFLKWQKQTLRKQWADQDNGQVKGEPRPLDKHPIIDPDIIDKYDLVDGVAHEYGHNSNKQEWKAADFLAERFKQVDDKIVELREDRQDIKKWDLKQFLNALATYDPSWGTSMSGIDYAEILKLRQLRDKHDPNFDAELNRLILTTDEFAYLNHMVEIYEANQTILSSEWSDLYNLIVQRIKQFVWYPTWLDEEKNVSGNPKGLALSPDNFVERPGVDAGDPEWSPSTWLSDEAIRREWEGILRARSTQMQDIIDGARTAVDTVEEAILPRLRDQMLWATVKGNNNPPDKKWFTRYLQINVEAGACQMTTRIAQPIETIQGLLSGAREGLLEDNSIKLDADYFDEEWKWIGTYANWRAAMQVFLYPEMVLRPTLRKYQSPAFADLVEYLRSNVPLDVDQLRLELDKYQSYFQDVCNMDLDACASGPEIVPFGEGPSKLSTYLIGRSTTSSHFYFSYIDPILPVTQFESQSFWTEIPILAGAEKVIGAVCCRIAKRTSYLYVFVQSYEDDHRSLSFTRLRLEQNFEWEKLVPLELPSHATDFTDVFIKQPKVDEPIRLDIWVNAKEGYTRTLDSSGQGWEKNPPKQIPLSGNWSHLGKQDKRLGADFVCTNKPGYTSIATKFSLVGNIEKNGPDVVIAAPDRSGTEGNDLWVMKLGVDGKSWEHFSPIAGHPFEADIYISSSNYAIKFAVMGDFDGDGQKEIVAALDGSPIVEGVATNLFWAKKYMGGTLGWTNLGKSAYDISGLVSPLPLHDPNEIAFDLGLQDLIYEVDSAIIGDFDGDTRDEIAFPLVDGKMNGQSYYHNVFLIKDLGEDGLWRDLPNLVWHSDSNVHANFAVAGDFNGDGKDEIAVARKKDNATEGNDLLIWQFDGQNWVELPYLDCDAIYGSTKAISAKFAVVGKFDHSDRDLIAVAKDTNQAEFWVAKMDQAERWIALSEIKGGPLNQNANFAVAGDFDGDSYDEIAIAHESSTQGAPDFWIADWNPDPAVNNWNPVSELNATRGHGARFKGVLAGKFSREDHDQLAIQYEDYNAFGAVTFNVTGDSGIGGSCSIDNSMPNYAGPSYSIQAPTTPEARLDLANQSRVAYVGNSSNRRTNQAYIEEAFYFLRIEVGLRLCESGNYKVALDWLRSVYDYELLSNQRQISYQLVRDAGDPDFTRVLDNWLLDPLNPHAIAEVRKGSYTKYTILSIVRCLLDYADAEFTRASRASVPHARALYQRALDLLDGTELNQHTPMCADLIGQLDITIGHDEEVWVRSYIRKELGQIKEYAALSEAVNRILPILESKNTANHKLTQAQGVLNSIQGMQNGATTIAQAIQSEINQRRKVMMIVISNPKFPKGTSLPQEVPTGNGAGTSHFENIPAPHLGMCIPFNPMIQAARNHANLNLHKIDTCKNIAGMEMRLEPYDDMTAMTAISSASGDQLPSSDTTDYQPLPYRYATLIERAKQLVDLARQIEASMLNFIERADQKRYEELKARQDLVLAQAGLRLKDLQLTEANDNVGLAQLQRNRAILQRNEYSRLMKQDVTVLEKASLALMGSVVVHESMVAASYTAAAIQQAYSVSSLLDWWGQSSGNVAQALSATASMLSTTASITSTLASYERRRQEWQFQQVLTSQDVAIGQQQIAIAFDRVNIATQEQSISRLQIDNAKAVLDFLTTKEFTNSDLYDWMSNISEQVYRYFLLQATCIAKLAQHQLAFERQEGLKNFIKADYWERPKEGTPDVSASGSSGQLTSLHGLTGSARLLRDIYELDQYAFLKNQRKLQLSETISLAQLDPFAFQQFCETGVLNFATPQALFDRKFPGHYLRLVKRVRTSIIALIPPSQGIRATLSTVGTSRTVIGPDVFTKVVVQRGPESVALTSPINATGLFELDAQPELVLPFEGIGVDTAWEFRMPKPANQFDYATIADVILTIEYTALNSYDYREQVIKKLEANQNFSGDRAYSFRNNFADSWYDLHNPDETAQPMTVTFETVREDFPPNLTESDLQIAQVVLYLASSDKTPISQINVRLNLNGKGGTASTKNGVASTRTGNASTWIKKMVGKNPIGTWTLTLPNDQTTRDLFKTPLKGNPSQYVTDILFVITYSARTLEWPT